MEQYPPTYPRMNVDPGAYAAYMAYRPTHRGLYVLLGLFLGFLGIHDFYAGRIRWAMSHLLFTIFLGWLLVPLVLLAFVIFIELCVVTRDGRGNPMQ